MQLDKMRSYARKVFNRLRSTDPEFMDCHDSHVAAEALKQTEQQFGTYNTAETHGVEGFTDHGGCTYLNTGNGYTPTVYYRKGQFRIGCWADIVENC